MPNVAYSCSEFSGTSAHRHLTPSQRVSEGSDTTLHCRPRPEPSVIKTTPRPYRGQNSARIESQAMRDARSASDARQTVAVLGTATGPSTRSSSTRDESHKRSPSALQNSPSLEGPRLHPRHSLKSQLNIAVAAGIRRRLGPETDLRYGYGSRRRRC